MNNTADAPLMCGVMVRIHHFVSTAFFWPLRRLLRQPKTSSDFSDFFFPAAAGKASREHRTPAVPLLRAARVHAALLCPDQARQRVVPAVKGAAQGVHPHLERTGGKAVRLTVSSLYFLSLFALKNEHYFLQVQTRTNVQLRLRPVQPARLQARRDRGERHAAGNVVGPGVRLFVFSLCLPSANTTSYRFVFACDNDRLVDKWIEHLSVRSFTFEECCSHYSSGTTSSLSSSSSSVSSLFA
jgi:hypothetical protein